MLRCGSLRTLSTMPIMIFSYRNIIIVQILLSHTITFSWQRLQLWQEVWPNSYDLEVHVISMNFAAVVSAMLHIYSHQAD